MLFILFTCDAALTSILLCAVMGSFLGACIGATGCLEVCAGATGLLEALTSAIGFCFTMFGLGDNTLGFGTATRGFDWSGFWIAVTGCPHVVTGGVVCWLEYPPRFGSVFCGITAAFWFHRGLVIFRCCCNTSWNVVDVWLLCRSRDGVLWSVNGTWSDATSAAGFRWNFGGGGLCGPYSSITKYNQSKEINTNKIIATHFGWFNNSMENTSI